MADHDKGCVSIRPDPALVFPLASSFDVVQGWTENTSDHFSPPSSFLRGRVKEISLRFFQPQNVAGGTDAPVLYFRMDLSLHVFCSATRTTTEEEQGEGRKA